MKSLLVFSLLFFAASGARSEVDPSAPPCEVAVVGTIHDKHATEPGYPLTLLERLIDLYQPSLVLIEISEGELANEDWSRTPPEMAFIATAARKRGIALTAFDEPPQAEQNPDPFQEKLKELRRSLNEAIGSFSCARVNSAAADIALEKYFTERDRILPPNHPLRVREAFQDREIARILRNAQARPALLFTGFTHRLHVQAAATGAHCRLIPIEIDQSPAHL